MTIPRELKDAGFDPKPASPPKIVFLGLDGHTKSGRTHFSIENSPEPIGYVDIDKRGRQVLKKFPKKEIYPIRISNKDNQDEAIEEFLKFENAWYRFLEIPGGGTMVVDTHSEIWELGRMAEFGKTLQVKPHHYAALNLRFNRMLDAVWEHDKNVILIHKLVEEYKNEKPTGGWRRQGYKNTEFKALVNATLSYDEKKGFKLRVDSCGEPIELTGREFEGPLATFDTLAEEIYGPAWGR